MCIIINIFVTIIGEVNYVTAVRCGITIVNHGDNVGTPVYDIS